MVESSNGTRNIAVFIDLENVAIGVRDANYKAFDIGLVMKRLVDKGNVVVRKAYADWSRYEEYRRPLHEAGVELLEMPGSKLTGKNSADIKMVVDALELSYTKPHIDVFALVSGDSDFSPLVAKLRFPIRCARSRAKYPPAQDRRAGTRPGSCRCEPGSPLRSRPHQNSCPTKTWPSSLL